MTASNPISRKQNLMSAVFRALTSEPQCGFQVQAHRERYRRIDDED